MTSPVRQISILCFVLLVMLSCTTRPDLISQLQDGDLLFCLSSEDNHITDVTEGIDGARIDHVGIVVGRQVLEAVHAGVVLTPIDSFLCRRDSLVMVARLTDTLGIHRSVERALQYLGRPYDFLFMPDDSALYCSELVQTCYLDGEGRQVFPTIPMSFHDETGTVTSYWKDYYARRGMEVPEGAPGSNPGDLSRSSRLRILFRFF